MPISGVKVTLIKNNLPVEETITDVNGAYAFANLNCGEYSVLFEKDGYVSKQNNGIIVENSVNSVSDACLEEPVVILCFGSVQGTIQIDNSGVVTPAYPGNIYFTNTVTLDEYSAELSVDGVYLLEDLPCGTYTVYTIAGDPAEFLADSDEILIEDLLTTLFNKTYISPF